MTVKVWREVVRVQRNFLWGGLSKRRRISWVKWTDICKPKKDGGLGIRDIRLVNLSLLAKWRWKLFLEEEEVWRNVLEAKYGEGVLGNACIEPAVYGNGCSPWWNDLCRFDREGHWFNQVAVKKLGCGNTIKFWKEVWVGNLSLEQHFPRLFNISVQQDKLISEMGSWCNGVWRWELLWRRNFFVWEESMVLEIEEVINNVVITEVEDRWVWSPNVDEGFSVKSLYFALDELLLEHTNLNTFQTFVFKNIRKGAVPSKVSAFAWQLFLDRIPTKENLARRGLVRIEDTTCSLCDERAETSCHLFLHCRFAAAVWYAINRWLGVVVVLPAEPMMSYGLLVGSGGNKKIRKGFSIVWLAFVWVLWRARNDRVFNNVGDSVDNVVERIQRTSWQWYLHKTAKGSSLLYEWIWNPGDCMMR
ncbi:putative ribonuclease H protein [Trifolium medium]|uniref:Putative ribonuclease H protein n=1 Tax=Trifolium medium TaxID=97028 RepID=A0A392MBP6_9FABA|nr:putative ribonuclease H protein [Trifolium medium]